MKELEKIEGNENWKPITARTPLRSDANNGGQKC